jgi:hypothetical protein
MKKTKKVFPDFYKAVCNDKLRPILSCAIIENGKIVISDGHYMICSDFGIFVENHRFAEKKVFNRNLLKWMRNKNFNRLVCTEKGIAGYDKKGNFEEMPYSGYIEIVEKKTEERTCFSRLLYIYQNEKDEKIGVFPNWLSCMPDKTVFSKSEGFNTVGINFKSLTIISDCFLYETEEKLLKMEFLKSTYSIIRITPLNSFYEIGMQEAILMPV